MDVDTPGVRIARYLAKVVIPDVREQRSTSRVSEVIPGVS